MSKRTRLVGVVVACIAVAGAVVVGTVTEDAGKHKEKAQKVADADESLAPSEDAKTDVTIAKAGFEDSKTWGDDAYVIHWQITNSTSRQASYFASIDFFGQDGKRIGGTGVVADNLGPRKTQEGSASPSRKKVDPTDIAKVKVGRVYRVKPLAEGGAD